MILFTAFSLSAVFAGCSVKVYGEDVYWNSPSCTINSDSSNIVESISARSGCPDSNVRKIILDGKCSVELWEDTEFGGAHVRLENTDTWSKTISDLPFTTHRSLRVDEIKSCGAHPLAGAHELVTWTERFSVRGVCGPCRVTFSELRPHKDGRVGNFLGKWCDRGVAMNSANIANAPDCPATDKLNFLMIEGSCKVELYEKPVWQGQKWTANGDVTDMVHWLHLTSGIAEYGVKSFKILDMTAEISSWITGRRMDEDREASASVAERIIRAAEHHDLSTGREMLSEE